ncbi:aubergine [Nesidiocoris tenuis]|uniref:Aubergine n=1 Tax=Nesidiocoris tenuis TaxID=355587 RepID=A0ABN7BBD8_9HEMI|nr:aubergine [Nesidiocoris tenuis]
MIVGFDVTHSKSKGRSVGALVASMNDGFSRYFSAISMHSEGEELSKDIAMQMAKAIVKFKSYNNGAVPSKIIFYRDGVGDGNIHYVLQTEVKRINDELKPFYPKDDLKLTYIIVTKKINTRLFYGNENPVPGTVVDDVITQPERYDFFLVSQCVNQGTVSPTHFNVIYDTGNNGPDMLQRLSFKLCHLYFNWSGTVRVPAPVQYAHKLAFLVGQAIRTAPNTGLEDLLYFL